MAMPAVLILVGLFGHLCSLGDAQAGRISGPVDVHRQDITIMAGFAAEAMTAQSNGQTPIQLVKINSARTQVADGINYYLTITVTDGSQVQKCNAVVFDQSWTGKRQMKFSKCSTIAHASGSCPGCTSGPVIQQMAYFAVQSMNQHKIGPPYTLVKVVSTTTQVANGVHYSITLKISDGHHAEICDVDVFDQFWIHTRQLIKHHCHPDPAPL